MQLTVTPNGRLPTPIALVGDGGLGTLTAMEVLVIGGHGQAWPYSPPGRCLVLARFWSSMAGLASGVGKPAWRQSLAIG